MSGPDRSVDSTNGMPGALRIAYLVVTHAMPDHLGRLIGALTDVETDFYVHVDRKVPIEPFLAHAAPNVSFLEARLPVYWGQWQMVEATLRLIGSALQRGPTYDYLVLLSGSCYPIRSREYIRAHFAAHAGEQFINCVAMPSVEAGKGMARLDRFYRRQDLSLATNLWRAANGAFTRRRSGRVLSKHWLLSRDWRRALGSLRPHGGSSWWALTGDACRYIDEFAHSQPSVVRFFENTRFPDEVVFQTVLANSPFAQAVRRGLMYADWSARGRHPAWITERHVRAFAEPGPMIGADVYGRGEICFARKFPDDGGRMASLVDEVIRHRG